MTAVPRPALIVFSGLPGCGKTTLAEALARITNVPVFSIAWILGVLIRAAVVDESNRGTLGYEMLTALATRQLLLGQSAILDAMAGSTTIRERWEALARDHEANFCVVECICSDEATHQARIAQRREHVPGWPNPDWKHVQEMRAKYSPWIGERLVLDSIDPFEHNFRSLLRHLELEETSPSQ